MHLVRDISSGLVSFCPANASGPGGGREDSVTGEGDRVEIRMKVVRERIMMEKRVGKCGD